MNNFFSMIEPSEDLKNSIINKIRAKEKKGVVYKTVFGFGVSALSVFLTAISAMYIFKDFQQSGLSEYLSLIFSDGALLFSYWQTYAMSIVESLPVFQITIIFASIWTFVWSLKIVLPIFKNAKNVFNNKFGQLLA